MSLIDKAPGLTIYTFLLAAVIVPLAIKYEVSQYKFAHAASLADRVAQGAAIVQNATTDPKRFILHKVSVNNLTATLCFEFEGKSMFGMARSTAMISKSGELFLRHDKDFPAHWERECQANLTVIKEDPPIAGDSMDNILDLKTKAEQGDAQAQNTLAVYYSEGKGLPRNDAEALKWYRKAAEQGNKTAQWSLGLKYLSGTGGLAVDYTQSEKWFRRSAEQGFPLAELDLGVLYSGGYKGEPMKTFKLDKIEADFWFTVAGKLGDKRRLELERVMTPEEISEVRTRASEWKPKPISSTR